MLHRQIRWRPRASALLLVALSMALAAGGARSGSAEDMSDLYKATTIVTGTDMRSRPTGFAQCLREVLVKVSGEPKLRRDPRVADLASRAGTLVVSFTYVDQMAGLKVHDDQGTYDRSQNLTVRFDRGGIDGALAELGQSPWRDERPIIVPVISVHGVTSSYLLSAEVPAGDGQRGALLNAGDEFGIGVRIPTEAELAAMGASVGQLPSAQTDPSPAEARVVGTLEFNEELPGWVGAWRMRWRGTDYDWGIKGVNFDEALRDVVRGVVRVASGHGAPDS